MRDEYPAYLISDISSQISDIVAHASNTAGVARYRGSSTSSNSPLSVILVNHTLCSAWWSDGE